MKDAGTPGVEDAALISEFGAALVTVTCGPVADSHDPYRSTTSTGNSRVLSCSRTAGVRAGAASP